MLFAAAAAAPSAADACRWRWKTLRLPGPQMDAHGGWVRCGGRIKARVRHSVVDVLQHSPLKHRGSGAREVVRSESNGPRAREAHFGLFGRSSFLNETLPDPAVQRNAIVENKTACSATGHDEDASDLQIERGRSCKKE